jgi:hypothetical protein
MTRNELVAKIAHLRNISPNFLDYKNNFVSVPIENIEMILGAMGYDLENFDKTSKDAWILDTEQWHHLLEPILYYPL